MTREGKSNWGQPGSNSPELTRGSSPARPGTAEGYGKYDGTEREEREREGEGGRGRERGRVLDG